MAIVSDIEIRLRADIARLQQDMDRARQSVGGAMSSITSAARAAAGAIAALGVGLSAAAFAQWIKGAIDATDVVSDLSQKTGVAIKDIAGLQLWFQKGGTEAGAFESSMIKLSRNIAEGGEAFARLGIKTKDANGSLRSNVDVLLDSADAFANLEDGTLKTALAVEMFGKSGAELIPLLNEGSQGLRDMQEMAEKLGLTFDEKTVEAAGQFNDTLDFMAGASQGVARQVAAQLLPTLNSLSESFLKLITEGDGVRKAADVIGTGFKILYTIGAAVSEIFNTVGKTIGAAAAQLVAILSGEFKLAAQIGREWFADVSKSVTGTAQTITDVWTGASGQVVEAMVKSQRAGTVVADKVDKDAQKQVDSYQALIQSIREKTEESQREADGLGPLNDAQKMGIKIGEDIIAGKLKLNEVQQDAVLKLLALYDANLKSIDSQEKYKKMQDELAKSEKALTDERDAALKKVTEEADANVELVATFGMTKKAVAELEVARLEEQLAQRSSLALTWDEIKALEDLIVQKKRSAAAIANVEDLQKQQQLWGDIEKTAHDTFVSIADGGKDAAQRLKETFKNVFFDWLYQQTLKKWIINLAPSTSSFGGSSGGGGLMDLWNGVSGAFTGGSSGSGGGASSNISSIMSAGKYLWEGFSTGFSGAASNAMSAFTNIPVIGWIIAGMAANNKYFKQGWDINGQTSDITKELWKASVKQNALLDPLGGHLLQVGAIASTGIGAADKLLRGLGLNDQMASLLSGSSLWTRAFGRRKPSIEEQGISGTVSASGFSGEAFAKILEKGGWFRSDKRYTKTAALDASQDTVFDETVMGVMSAVKDFATVLGLQTDVITGYSKEIKLVLTNDEEKNKEAIAALFQGISDEIATALLPSIAKFSAEGESATATLQRLATEFASVTAIMNSVGVDAAKAFGAVGIASIEARDRLVQLTGGISTLASQTDYFAQNFLTEAERLAPIQKNVTEQLAKLGYAGVTTSAGFRDAVLGLANSGKLATEEGAKTYAALLALAPGFKTVTQAAEEATQQAIAAAAEAAKLSVQNTIAAIEKAMDKERVRVERKTEAAISALSGFMDAVANNANNARALAAQARQYSSSVGSAALTPEATAAAAQMARQAIMQAAKSGQLMPGAVLQELVTSVQAGANGPFGSFEEFQRAQAQASSSLGTISENATKQAATMDMIVAQLTGEQALIQANADRAYAKMDALLIAAQTQADAALGSYAALQTLPQLFDGLSRSIAAVAASGGTAPTGMGITAGNGTQTSTGWHFGNTYNPGAYVPLNSTQYMESQLAVLNQQMTNLSTHMETTAKNTGRAAVSTDNMARDINNVTGGGNAMITESVGAM